MSSLELLSIAIIMLYVLGTVCIAVGCWPGATGLSAFRSG